MFETIEEHSLQVHTSNFDDTWHSTHNSFYDYKQNLQITRQLAINRTFFFQDLIAF